MEAWKAEDDCYYVRTPGLGWWYEVTNDDAIMVRAEDGMRLDDYMDRYVLTDTKRVNWDDAPGWVREHWG